MGASLRNPKPRQVHAFNSTSLQPPSRKLGPIPPLSPTDTRGLPSDGAGVPLIAGEGPLEKPASNRRNAAELDGKKRQREKGRNRKAPARLVPSPPRRRSAGTELLQKRRRAVIRPAQGLRFARSRNPSSTVTCFSTNRMPPLGLTASPQVGGAGRLCVRPSGRPGGPPGPLPRGGQLQVHPGQGAAEGTGLSPSCSPPLTSKTRSVRYGLGPRRRGKAELPPCSLFYYSTRKQLLRKRLCYF